MILGKFMVIPLTKDYNILLRIRVETPSVDTDDTKEKVVTSALKTTNKIEYNKLIISQEYTVYDHIVK